MSKRGPLNDRTAKHGWQKHYLHEIHQEQQKARASKKKKYITVKLEVAEEEKWPVFRSDVSSLGGGKALVVEKKDGVVSLKEEDGWVWLDLLREAKSKYDWYHYWDPGANPKKDGSKKGGWKTKWLDDRYTEFRNPTDVLRETIDLRPDHSRVVQYLLEAGRKAEVESVLAEVRQKKIELFEEIYKRRVLYCAEHDDAGQHHDDLWHCGIEESPTEKSWHEKELVPRRSRTEFRSYGVSTGCASWNRHIRAFKEAGMPDRELDELAGTTIRIIRRNARNATAQNLEEARDLRLLQELDAFAKEKLEALDPEIYQRGLGEYSEHLKAGYQAGMLGLLPSKELEMAERVDALQNENSTIREKLQASENRFLDLAESVGVLLRHLGREVLAKAQSVSDQVRIAVCKLTGVVGMSLPEPLLAEPAVGLTAEKQKRTMKKEMEGPSV